MKKLLVYDCAAESGGALSVLRTFYSRYVDSKEYESFFATSVVELDETERCHNIRLVWVKKSWLHRLYCDFFYMPRLIKKLGAKEVLSLQNIGIPRCHVKQTVYVHNAIPFTERRFSLMRDPFLWVYQNVIGRMTICSLRKVDHIIVQTNWMKEAIAEKCNISVEKITVAPVQTSFEKNNIRVETQVPIFFYPATAFSFKNHRIIFEACNLLKQQKIDNYRFALTLNGNENDEIKNFAEKASELNMPVDFVGTLNKDEMAEYYKKSILVFPSYLETVGLPLLEAKAFDAPILASDCRYAHDAIGEYEKCAFFRHDDKQALYELMKNILQKEST